ncbi:hypothetical protein [Roseicyclus sediminis]|uniref:hypothetical protein n=1 Tax=Roseicyclus sediminis TaxID=2980997 RepID=UPI0021CFD24A|nr:hypothetical protein [Roseibacterium sp. SDUM158016]
MAPDINIRCIFMSYFEYKVLPAPLQSRRRQKRLDGMDKYASTIADLMTEMGLEGWDFIGAEALRERRRKFLFLIHDVERTIMVFRRPAPLHDLGKDAPGNAAVEPVAPRRVRRPDLVAEVAAGGRRIPVTSVKRPETDGGDAGSIAAE